MQPQAFAQTASGGADCGAADRCGHDAMAMIDELAAFSERDDCLLRRFLTPEHRRAADRVAAWMRQAGCEVTEDALGTVRGLWRSGPAAKARRLLVGSHIDTVVDAGRFDGTLGVVAGILAVAQLAQSASTLPFDVEVLAFGDEEGSRFASTYSSSAAAAGLFDPAWLTQPDAQGISLTEALRRYGKDVAAIPAAAYAPAALAGYIEVHIEQGPVLEARAAPLGIVTGIVGQSRLQCTLGGEAGHAGCVPMRLRRDALAGAAEIALVVERTARDDAEAALVASVGRFEVSPGASNVIAGRAALSIDVRSLDDERRRRAVAAITAEARQIAERRRLDLAIETVLDAPATHCDAALQDALASSVAMLGHPIIRLPSGAGHDAQMIARVCPVGMLFVRCRGGLSHNPAEFASADDMGLAVMALVGAIEAHAKATGA